MNRATTSPKRGNQENVPLMATALKPWTEALKEKKNAHCLSDMSTHSSLEPNWDKSYSYYYYYKLIKRPAIVLHTAGISLVDFFNFIFVV